MKKIIALCIGLLFASTIHAQWFGNKKVTGNGHVVKTDRKTGDYDHIGVAGMYDVVLVSGTEGNITIEAEENLMEYIETEVKGNTLNIKTTRGINLRPRKKIRITVPFRDISAVSLAGSGSITGQDLIKANDFKTSLAGSGDIDLAVEAGKVESNIAGSGDIRLKGKTKVYEANVSGSGDIHAYDLIAEQVHTAVSGSGDIQVHCNDMLKARVSGSGNISYKGNAREDSKVSGSGKIRKTS
ncbi:head GIN domain-containing protein [Sinomicrobium oceani]|uniref:head GIN domain-containing protein n=1 Tax=Sinomicrobium oceani TaxID=1150368 RepID=UPI00227CE630|nr:head GIN domain-containing protein [Sinomicrobium oceani]